MEALYIGIVATLAVLIVVINGVNVVFFVKTRKIKAKLAMADKTGLDNTTVASKDTIYGKSGKAGSHNKAMSHKEVAVKGIPSGKSEGLKSAITSKKIKSLKEHSKSHASKKVGMDGSKHVRHDDDLQTSKKKKVPGHRVPAGGTALIDSSSSFTQSSNDAVKGSPRKFSMHPFDYIMPAGHPGSGLLRQSVESILGINRHPISISGGGSYHIVSELSNDLGTDVGDFKSGSSSYVASLPKSSDLESTNRGWNPKRRTRYTNKNMGFIAIAQDYALNLQDTGPRYENYVSPTYDSGPQLLAGERDDLKIGDALQLPFLLGYV
uniref:Uncharacterized protein n=1 Tax=Ditylenchus dipsaci TaxID=166011 RepID=A0A915DPI6_9BILA